MTTPLIQGDHVSCSRVGGAMRRESSQLRRHARSLDDALDGLAARKGPDADAVLAAIAATLRALQVTADDLDEAGAALQCYATDLAEGHELGRRAELRVQGAGLLLDGTRVIEPWGPASAQEAERRRAQVPEVQARVDLATALVGRARGRLGREMTQLAESFSGDSLAARSARPTPPSPRRSPLAH
jgi:hypothetical protein